MPKKMASVLSPEPNTTIKLSDFDPNYHGEITKEQAKEELSGLTSRLALLQEKLYAEHSQSLLIVLQAMDTGGKDGTIKQVFKGINPLGVSVASFKAPSSDELAHDFLWRIHQRTPTKGHIVIFNRSHYEDVLVVRVNNLVLEKVWKKRYDHINNFEKMLADSGTRIIKFFLNISKEEQKERLEARLNDPEKHWKFSKGDLPVREQWDDYMRAYQDVLTRCNTAYAPWYIIPANRKWYRNLVVSRIIVETLESMNPQFPPAEEGLDQVVIPD